MKIKPGVLHLSAAVLFFIFTASTTSAQSTVMNAPSTDVVSARKVYLEMDFITNYAWARGDERFANYLPRAVVGVGKNIEVGANVSYTRVPGGGEPLELQPNAKWQFYSNEEKGLAASVGCMWFVPVTHRSGTDTFGQCYSVASKRFKGDYGPRFTGGAYTLIAASRDQGTRTGAIAAYEQPLANRLSFIVDWQTGDNRFGFISPALNVSTPRNGNLSAGYAIANRGRGRNWLFLFYGQQF
ncbi:MAG TPA: hypothetical protein VJT71_21030 [Pyrinomonadaceae bacterium]|nr:hypothetical protein [Pyrinomonadaceae bacterium]